MFVSHDKPPVEIEKWNTNWFCTLPKRKGAVLLSLIQLPFVGSCGGNLCSFGFHLPELCRTDKADTAPRLSRGQEPGDLFHLRFAGQALVFVPTALTHRKTDLALDIEVTAEDFFFRGAKALNDVCTTARPAQRVGALRSSPFDFYGDHTFLFSKEALQLFGLARGAQAHREGTPEAVTRANVVIRTTMRHTLGRATPRII